jgi:hypothetical protein
LTLWTLREPGGLDQRRAALGLEPEAQNRTRLLAAERTAPATVTSRQLKMAEVRRACQHHEPTVREAPPSTHCHAADRSNAGC